MSSANPLRLVEDRAAKSLEEPETDLEDLVYSWRRLPDRNSRRLAVDLIRTLARNS